MPGRAAAEVRERFECLEERVECLEERADVWELVQMMTDLRKRLQALERGSKKRSVKRSRRRRKSR